MIPAWLLFALIAPGLWAIGNILQKIILKHHVPDSLIYVRVSAFSALPLALLPLFLHTDFPPLKYMLPIAAIGFITCAAFWLYIKSLTDDHVSRIIPLFQITPLFVLLFAALFLREVLLPIHYAGFFLILGGGALLSIRKIEQKFHLSKGFYLMLISSILYAVHDVAVKFVSQYVSFWAYISLICFGYFIAANVYWIMFSTPAQKSSLQKTPLRKIGAICGIELMGWTGMLLYWYAILLGSVTLVSSVDNFQTFFVFILAVLLSYKFPRLLEEDISWKTIAIKAVSIIIMSIGVGLISQ